MNFAEVRFWQLLAGGLATLLLVRGMARALRLTGWDRFDKLALLGLGLFLLLNVSWLTFVIFLVVALGTYAGLLWILGRPERGHWRYLWLLIPLQLAPLFYYKYASFVCNQVFDLGFDTWRDVVIPVGISFYTFQKVAFVVDTLAFKQPLPRLLDYLNFAGFFPQIVAGPIERRRDLLPQMERFRFRWLPLEIDAGAPYIALGLFFKCCLADNLAAYFDPQATANPILIWLANVIFGLRIYYDFAGYSLVALGLARCLGVGLTLNFASPYCATSIAEFWRRWHITLSQWFRDYLYVPLGGGRVRTWAVNVAVVFVVSGVWHGAGWNFVLWGGLHGAFLIGHRLLAPRLKIPAVLGWVLTMFGSCLAWLCFYELDTGALISKLRTLLTPAAYDRAAVAEALRHWSPGDMFTLVSILSLAVATLFLEWQSIVKRNEPYYWLRQPALLMPLVVLTVMLAVGKNNGFIYFAF